MNYRKIIYDHYLSFSTVDIEQQSSHLILRGPYFKSIIQRWFPLDRSAKILEIGCGAGGLIYYAQGAGYLNMFGVDTSPQQVETAQKLGVQQVQCADLMEFLISFKEESLDMIIALDVLEHFNKEETCKLIDQIMRVLKPQGDFLLHVPNGESPFFGAIAYGDYTHEQFFTSKSICQLMHAFGFSSVNCFEDSPIPHGLKSQLRAWAWILIRLGLGLITIIETGSSRQAIFSRNVFALSRKP